jgi:hypothetical protein
MKKLVLIALVAFLGSIMVPSALMAQAKEKKVVETKAMVVEKTRGANPEIKGAKPTDDTPAEKVTNRGANDLCYITIDNWCRFAVDIYIDYNYKGTVAGYGTLVTYAIPGRTRLYAESVGGTRHWGPVYFDCDYTYTWKLTCDD